MKTFSTAAFKNFSKKDLQKVGNCDIVTNVNCRTSLPTLSNKRGTAEPDQFKLFYHGFVKLRSHD